MAKSRDFRVRRWVLMKGGEFSTDAEGGQWSPHLEDAHIFIGRPRQTIAVRSEPVIVMLEQHEQSGDQ